MNIGYQIKKYRKDFKFSQEELAEKIFVTRQTISNWENNKNYPDINSLILLSDIFNISLDLLVKGDVEIMKEKINKSIGKVASKEELLQYKKYNLIYIFTFSMFLFLACTSLYFASIFGAIISVILFSLTIYVCMKIDRIKKSYDVSTYKEIIAF